MNTMRSPSPLGVTCTSKMGVGHVFSSNMWSGIFINNFTGVSGSTSPPPREGSGVGWLTWSISIITSPFSTACFWLRHGASALVPLLPRFGVNVAMKHTSGNERFSLS